MMTVTFRLRKKVVMAVLCTLVVVMAGIVAISASGPDAVSVFGRKGGAAAATNEQRIEYIRSCGWEVEETPMTQAEVTIPQKFDTIYVGYNQIQKSQGFNLEKYKGKSVTKYSYAVKITEDDSSAVPTVASLLVYEDKIIGADLCSRELGGFLKALGDIPS